MNANELVQESKDFLSKLGQMEEIPHQSLIFYSHVLIDYNGWLEETIKVLREKLKVKESEAQHER